MRRLDLIALMLFALSIGACTDPGGGTEEPRENAAKAIGFTVEEIDVQVDQLAAKAFAELGISAEEVLTDPLLQIQAALPIPAIKLSIVGDPASSTRSVFSDAPIAVAM